MTAVQHTDSGAGAPVSAPPSIGAHYTDTSTGDQYLGKGTTSAADWVRQEQGGAAVAAVQAHEGAGDPHPNYVLKETGKGLSANNYTTEEKGKLAGLESSHFKGLFASLAALQAAVPSPAAGDYANVDSGVASEVVRYLWDVDDSTWVEQLGTSAQLTAAQIKTEYESNPDTNAFSDAEKEKLAAIPAGGGGYEVGDVIFTLRDPGAGYVMPGTTQLQATYPELFAIVGLIDGGAATTENWAARPFGQATGDHNCIATDGAGVWIAGGPANGQILRSSDDGETWAVISTGAAYDVKNLTTDGAGVWLAAAGETGKARRSTDNGLTWAEVTISALTSSCDDVCLAANGVAVAVGYSGKMARSTDFGATWASVTSGFSATAIRAIRTDGAGNWVALGWYGKTSYSANDGATFTLTSGTPLGTTNMETLDTDKAGVWIGASAEENKVVRSTNNGAAWTNTGATFQCSRVRHISGSEWIATGSDGIIRRSTDGGLTWANVETLASSYMADVARGDDGTIIGVLQWGDTLLEPAPSYPYDSETEFKVPDITAPAGTTAYVKAA